MAFTAQHYRPENMVLFVKGDIDFRRIVRMAEKYTKDIILPHPKADVPSALGYPLPVYEPRTLTVQKDTHQAHVLLGGRAYDANDERRTALYLLNNLLGGPGMNSRLNIALREKRGLVYTVESNLTSYTDTGAWCIYFGCDHDDIDHCLELVHRELRLLCTQSLTSAKLTAAQKQLIGQIGVACDNFENRALDMAKSFLHYNRLDPVDKLFARIQSLTASQLLDVANDMFSPERISTLIYR